MFLPTTTELAKVTLEQLRALRLSVRKLNQSCFEDLTKFQQENEGKTYRRLPSSNPTKVNVSTTCTVLMALASNGLLKKSFGPLLSGESTLATLFKHVTDCPWESSGLEDGNAFTEVMVLRTAGFLAKVDPTSIPGLIGLKKKREGPSLRELAIQLSSAKIPECFKLDNTLRENPALGYWLIDALDNLAFVDSQQLATRFWVNLAEWSASEFLRQQSLVAAEHDIMMDPVAMATAACLIQRLRATVEQRGFGAIDWIESRKALPSAFDASLGDVIKEKLPSIQELLHGLQLFFTKQLPSGIWDKYFPMFYYRDDGKRASQGGESKVHYGGANYCFAFELLEAIINEFGSTTVEDPALFAGLEKACRWCEINRLEYTYNQVTYKGWNSGQQVNSLSRGEPESWATGVVHMFLRRLDETLTNTIRERVWDHYQASIECSKERWNELIDSDLPPLELSSKDLLKQEMLEKLESKPNDLSDVKRSALLFGPPGTGKTSLAKAAAARLGWRYLEISPSRFLDEGIENIYRRADEVFRDLRELSHTVVLFDEVDALVQTRDAEGASRLNVTQQFLTTSMLPKLTELHDQGQVIFFMATNYFKNFDHAITRPGRFDLLMCIGPPSWKEKKKRLEHFIPKRLKGPQNVTDARVAEAIALFQSVENGELHLVLELTTRGEFLQLCADIWRDLEAGEKLDSLKCRSSITARMKAVRKYMILRPDEDNSTANDYKSDVERSRIQ